MRETNAFALCLSSEKNYGMPASYFLLASGAFAKAFACRGTKVFIPLPSISRDVRETRGTREMRWMRPSSSGNRRSSGDEGRRDTRPRDAIRKCVSFVFPLCAGRTVPLSYGRRSREALQREDSRFTSMWAPGNTESMSVLWNVLSCRAASFPIFRSTLACLVHDLFLRTIVLHPHPLFPLASSRQPVLSRTAAFRFDYLPGSDTYFLSKCYWTGGARPLRVRELLRWIFKKFRARTRVSVST